ncbi:unnamed protein product [Prorocentrum cordatum]|uniref:Uncharacterized protein n=1 Tax=Prorocentrum cordatum TaxID=2364126 RepID=A0ABN9U0P6_9DINO|nr:unnamed protein product [Polarella glacialis]
MRRFVDGAVFRAAEVAVATLEGLVCNAPCCCTDSASAASGPPRAIGALPAGSESLLPPLAPDERPVGPKLVAKRDASRSPAQAMARRSSTRSAATTRGR